VAALPPLITEADLTEYGYDPAAAGKIPSASARIRRAAGRQQITPGTSQVTLRGPGPCRLPQRPATAVTAAVDSDGNPVDVELDGQTVTSTACGPLTVTYTHGFDPLPDELIDLVCAVASRLAGVSSAMAAGVRTEQAGGESVTWGADGWAGTTGLTRPELEALRQIYPRLPRTTHLTPP
jgi:hypothetical protein